LKCVNQSINMKKIYSFSLTLMLVLIAATAVQAQVNNLWRLTDDSKINKQLFNDPYMPKSYKIYELDQAAFISRMAGAPHEKNVMLAQSNFMVTFPMSDGSMEQFRVVEAPVMHPDLAARYPGISSYIGKGVEHPGCIVRFDVSPLGTNAMLMFPDKSTQYIDRVQGNLYRLTSRDQFDTHRRFNCLTDAIPNPAIDNSARPGDANQPTLRTYRLALQSGAEFSQHFLDGTETTDAQRKAKVLIAQNAQMTRANGIFERDFSARLVIIPNNDLIIFLAAATDPIANASAPNGTTCQNSINTQIGSANYDIGHTESKGNDNGNAGCIGCVCITGKGLGWTVYSNPSLLDLYVVDYLTHEMGHQMGANHTFSFQTEGTGVNVEPGSGITIMGYAGITGTTDVAAHSIDNFHSKSIEQVTNYLYNGSGNSCAVPVANGNSIPNANAGADYIIPKSTPFALTGSATDADASDVLTYVWEQIDNRTNGTAFPNANATTGPMFRPYSPSTNPTTLFPSLQYILTGANGFTWEILPAVARNMNFRLQIRDTHGNGGGTASDNMIVTVNGTSGPFGVSAPNTTGISWQAGTTQTVTWTVNGSDQAPVSCANVKISLSTDGGYTWPVVLVANTPNDGSETITVPNNPTTTARIKVESIGNIFFDICNANFTITAPATGFSFATSAGANLACGSLTPATASLGTVSNGGFTTPINLTATGNPAGTTVTFSPNPVTPGTNTTIGLSNTNNLLPGTYNITVTGTAGASVQTTTVSVVVAPGSGPSFTGQPSDVAVCQGAGASFSSTTSGTGVTYQWQVSTDGGVTYTNITGANATTYAIASTTSAQNNTKYKLIATTLCGTSSSNVATLNVNSSPSITSSPTNATVCVGGSNTFTVAAAGGGLNYQWQLSTNGGTLFSNIAGANASSYTITGITSTINNYQYQVVVTGACPGTATSTPSVVTVGTAPNITTQPSDAVSCAGSSNTFTSAASGSGLSYQWQVSTDGGATYTNIPGATSATYTFTTAGTQNGNKYRVIVISASCVTPSTSSAATLTVNSLPAISTQPTSSTLCANSNVTFTAAASGTGINYQWQLSTDGGNTYTNIACATNATITLSNIATTQNGYQYHVVVSGTCAPAATSNAATLNVVAPTTVSAQPSNTSVCSGSNASFNVSATGTGAIYQWQVSTNGGASFTNISGANAATYNVNNTTTTQSGNIYHVLVSNATCTSPATSNNANLTVFALPNITANANETRVCTGSPVTLTASGANTYSWAPVGLTGAAVVVNPTVNPASPSLPNLVTYTVTGTDNNSCSSSTTVSVTADPLPVVTLSVIRGSVTGLLPGRTVTLKATVTPSGFNFVWRKNGVVIPGYSADTLVVSVDQIGSYTVEAVNASGFCNRISNELNVSDSITGTLFIYPNPNNGNFTVSFYNTIRNLNQIKKQTVTVFDSKGARVFTKTYDVSQGYNLLHVDLKNVQSGLYIVCLRDGYGNQLGVGKAFIRP